MFAHPVLENFLNGVRWFHRDDKLQALFDALCGCYLGRYLNTDFGRLRFYCVCWRPIFVCWTVFETARGASSPGFYMTRVGCMFLFVRWLLDRPLLRWMNVGWAKFYADFENSRWMSVGYPLDGSVFARRNKSSTYRGKFDYLTGFFEKPFSLFIAAHILSRTRREFRT